MGWNVSSSRTTVCKAIFASLLAVGLSTSSNAADSASIVGALRLSGIITGGTMPTNSADFNTMVAQVGNGDWLAAATTAVNSQYGANYLLRRLALQMQNAGYNAAAASDSDATAYLIAHFAGAGGIGASSLSKVWSNNVTCTVNVTRNGANANVHAADLTAAELNTIDWRSALNCTAGQQAVDFIATQTARQANNNAAAVKMTIPVKAVGGYTTLSDRTNDNSFAMVGATAGTNLRYIENLWMVATGMGLLDFASTEGRPQNVPRFVPENDPHFLIGNGQTACIACHAGGLPALNHGYSTLADLYDFAGDGLSYNKAPTTGTMKSLGSNANNRQKTLTCDLSKFTVCNPDSVGADANQSWDLASTWGARGLLAQMGWNGPTAGQGLNTLGQAIGKAGIVYSNFVKRVMKEVCPLGAVPDKDFASIVAAGQNSDDVKQMIAQVASNPACR
ncbi:MAG: hypothetical protein JST04_17725 [Bdellovibrionales bacterium]|nr:hypothetical protein [Bdellovibrionales bacterium]